jgi:hypothetical protein
MDRLMRGRSVKPRFSRVFYFLFPFPWNGPGCEKRKWPRPQSLENEPFRIGTLAYPGGFVGLMLPAPQAGLGIYRTASHVDLKVEVTADRDRVAGLPHRADALPGPNPVALADQGRAGHVCVEITAILAFAVEQQVVAVENRVVAGSEDAAAADRHKRCVAGGDDVEALMSTSATAGCSKLTYRTTSSMRTLDRKDVAVIGEAAAAGGEGRSWCGEGREEEEG